MKFIDQLRYFSRCIRGKYNPTAGDAFFKFSKGVIHVGANSGQERYFYHFNRLPVIWFEPIPEVFLKLQANILNLYCQECHPFLISNESNKVYDFHLTNNDGESSSIFEMKAHKELWPNVKHIHSIQVTSIKLDDFLYSYKGKISHFDTLVMDTQGSELMVLEGCINHIRKFKYIKLEAADFQAYQGNCTLSEIYLFMQEYGFQEINRVEFAHKVNVGSYYELVFKNTLI